MALARANDALDGVGLKLLLGAQSHTKPIHIDHIESRLILI